MPEDLTRLDRILELRRRMTDGHRVALARKQAELQRAQDRLATLESELESLQDELRQRLREAKVISPTQMLLGDVARQRLLDLIDIQRQEISEMEQEVARAREELVEARKNERVVELLRDRRLHRHLAKLRRIESDFLDELARRPNPIGERPDGER